ncbi:MAG: 2-succinyl-5-enolpyruvyl-6-hydroxy-3-cyclohexene-1-carboxylic-acid synthase [Flavobacteriaceae bacterium]|nr:2-succinyl-5-enolpyruvyl-6-hydroxy-3-cyclohexene-1-carboxylic-acid synthase [Flavobacteriaceae bacterium]
MAKFSAKLNVQLLAETLIQSGIENVVISPGSRNGALTMQFVNDSRFSCYSIVDERSAGFVALGMAQKIQKPVVICCTSGSAVANYYPAVTEAFYQNIPLIVLTADRPAAFTDLFDGQTIRQENLFEKHVYGGVQLAEDESDESLTANFLKVKEAVHTAIINSGPVHINMPFSEPLYEFTLEKRIEFDQIGKPKEKMVELDLKNLQNEYSQATKVMVLVGQQAPNESLNYLINQLSTFSNVIILTETTSNIYGNQVISQIDAVLRNIVSQDLSYFQPDLLITLGQNVISKKIKQFLRENRPKFHWHVDNYWQPDTYFSLTQKIETSAEKFLREFLDNFQPTDSDYRKNWTQINQQNHELQREFMQELPWSDLYVFRNIIQHFPAEYVVHYSNSAVIRYSQLFRHEKQNHVYCNRGTSGIDGSTSAAIGYAMKSEKPVVLVTGDISFFYDSNALWNNEIPVNFRIVLVNNGGGNIFSIIPGPENTNALNQFFETKHQLTAEYLAKMFDFEYVVVDSKSGIENIWGNFYHTSNRPKILEINTKNAPNAETLRAFIDV